ncbi:MAG: pyridoxine 5'-phosphate synthase [Myxococcota bacterium]
MPKLLIKLDHVASLREARRAKEPDPILAASLAELAGADGVVVHLRNDRRHIKERDLELLRQTVKSHLTIEITPTQEMLRLVRQIKPDRVMLVPERPDEITIESGLDVVRSRDMLSKELPLLQESGIEVGVFLDPDVDQVKAAHKLNTKVVHLNFLRCALAKTDAEREIQRSSLVLVAGAAKKLYLNVGLSHALTYADLRSRDIRGCKDFDEFVVGYAVMARAMMLGMDRAVRELVDLVK